MKKHLAAYKRSQLGIAEPGVFRYRNRDVPCDHILPSAQAWLNLLEPARQQVRDFLAANPKVTRHRYFHHLNSSQAFAFNLFFPYFSGGPNAASVLLRALGQNGVLAQWEPEAVPVPKERSNIDATWVLADGSRTFCEVKLSEAELGKAADDDRHRAKLRGIYEPALIHHVAASLLRTPAFFASYQFLRNVWHLVRNDGSRLIFLLPRSNTGLWKSLQHLLTLTAPETRQHISVVAIEDVIASLCADDRCPPHLRAYADQLRLKYILVDGATTQCR